MSPMVTPTKTSPAGTWSAPGLFGPSLRVAVFGLFMGVACSRLPAQTVNQLKQLSVEELMEVEVTSVSRAPIALSNAPSALQVITGQEISRSGAARIPEALRLANNLNVAQKNGHDWGISARGFNTDLANKLLVMIDGRTVYTPLFSGVRWDVQDYLLEDLDRIEVISGPGGSVWGANAVNGVINVTSKKAQQTQGFYGETGAGDQLEKFASASYGGKLGSNVYYRVYGKTSDRATESLASGADAGDSSALNQGGFRLDAVTAARADVTIQGDYYTGFEGMPGARDSKIAGGNLLSRWSQTFASGSNARLQLYYDRTYLHQPFASGAFGPAGYFSEDLITYDLDFQYSLKMADRHAVIWGFGYRYTDDHTLDAPALGFVPRDTAMGLTSGFIQDQYTLTRTLLLTLGTKLEHNEYTGFEIEPSVRLQLDLKNNQLLWGAISRAVRTPSRIDRDIREPSRGTTILSGGNTFKSETVVAYETGYRMQIGRHFAGSLALFYNDYENIRSLSTTAATFLPLFFANDLKGESHGFEFSFKSDLTESWRLTGGYTLQRTHLHVRTGGMDFNNTLNETSDPQSQVALGSAWDLTENIDLDLHLRHVGELENNNSGSVGTVPGYTDLTLRLGVRLTASMELSLVGQNLLDKRHPEFGTPGPSRVEINRSFFAKIAWRY